MRRRRRSSSSRAARGEGHDEWSRINAWGEACSRSGLHAIQCAFIYSPSVSLSCSLPVFSDSQDLTCNKKARTAKCLTLGRTDLPLKFHPAAIRVSAGFTPCDAGGATGDRRGRGGVAQPIARGREIGGISGRREVAQRGMRPPLVVIVDPVRNP